MYRLERRDIEIKHRDRHKIAPGVAIDNEGDKVSKFETLCEAKAALEKLSTAISYNPHHKFYFVSEWYLLDEDDEVIDFTRMVIGVVEKPSYETLATFETLKAAEEFADDYDGENEVFISI